MARQLFEHVVEKTDTGRDRIHTRPVEIDAHVDARFRRCAMNRACSHDGLPIVGSGDSATRLDRAPTRVHQRQR